MSVVCGATLAAAAANGADDDAARICAGERQVFDAPSFELFDANRDAALDEREASACESLSTIFEELDLDADERLTQVEYRSFAAVWQQRDQAFGDRD